MNEQHPLPPAEGLDALLDALVGWYEAGAAAEPRRAGEVERPSGGGAAIRQYLPLLERVGVLEPAGHGHRLTDAGAELGGALAAGDDRRARAVARSHLEDHPLVDALSGVLRSNPLPEEDLRPLLATLAGVDPDRIAPGVSTGLDLLEWAGLLDRDATGRYRTPRESVPIPDGSGAPRGTSGGVPAGQQPPPSAEQHHSPDPRYPPVSEPPQQPPDSVGGPSRRPIDPASEPAQQPPGPASEPPQRSPGPAGGQQPPAGDEEPARYATQDHALSVRLSVDDLQLDVDGDANELAEILGAVRRGLLPNDALGS